MLLVAMIGAALAGRGEWRKQPIEPRSRIAGTAYTLERGGLKLGLLSQSVGVLDDLQVGTQAIPLLLGAPNVQGKLTAIRSERFDVGVDAGVLWVEAGRFSQALGFEEDFDAAITASQLGFRASWIVSDRLSLHAGAAGYFVRARGTVGLDDLATVIATAAGADVEDELREAIGDETDVFARVDLAIPQYRFSVDVRLNRRDSIVLTSHGLVALTGQLNAGAETTASGEDGVTVEGGAYARVSTPLPDTLGSLTTISWNFDWRHVNLRIGVPLNPTNPLAWSQILDLHLRYGRSRTKRPPGWRDRVEVEDPADAVEDDEPIEVEDP